MNKHFDNITADSDLKGDSETLSGTPTSLNAMLERFHRHQKSFPKEVWLSFHEVTEDDVQKEVLRWDGTKAIPVGNIPAGMLKSITDTHTSILTRIFNSPYEMVLFQTTWKL